MIYIGESLVVHTMVNDRVNDMVSGRSSIRRKGKKPVPPSRLRYEQTHPTVTVRVSEEMREKLTELKEVHDLSLGDVLRIGLETAKPDLDKAYTQGLTEGYEDAKDEYEVTYWCSGCRRRHMSITTDEEKQAAAQLMYDAGWESSACS